MSYKYKLYGAILGDLAGQPYEFPKMQGPYTNVDTHNPKSHFTDDTLMTLASAKSILSNSNPSEEYRKMGNMYPGNYYGPGFRKWIQAPERTINDSWGNGCLMRMSPFMYTKEPLILMMKSIMGSHRHEISAQACLKLYNAYHSILHFNYHNVEPFKDFEVGADKTVDFCINLYGILTEASTQEYIVRAVECGGDTDTNASIVGELSNFFQKDITKEDAEYVESMLDPYLLDILISFNERMV